MKRPRLNGLTAAMLLTLGLFTSALWAETQGTFRGAIVLPPRGERAVGLLYLLGRDGNVRRVVVATAAIVYDAQVPRRDRVQSAQRALVPGAEVRVTALVDAKSGEWTASRVEILPRHVVGFNDDYGEDANMPDEVIAPREKAMASHTI